MEGAESEAWAAARGDEMAGSNRWKRSLMQRSGLSSALHEGIHHAIQGEPFQVIFKFRQVGCRRDIGEVLDLGYGITSNCLATDDDEKLRVESLDRLYEIDEGRQMFE